MLLPGLLQQEESLALNSNACSPQVHPQSRPIIPGFLVHFDYADTTPTEHLCVEQVSPSASLLQEDKFQASFLSCIIYPEICLPAWKIKVVL